MQDDIVSLDIKPRFMANRGTKVMVNFHKVIYTHMYSQKILEQSFLPLTKITYSYFF